MPRAFFPSPSQHPKFGSGKTDHGSPCQIGEPWEVLIRLCDNTPGSHARPVVVQTTHRRFRPSCSGVETVSINTWQFVVFTIDRDSDELIVYIDEASPVTCNMSTITGSLNGTTDFLKQKLVQDFRAKAIRDALNLTESQLQSAIWIGPVRAKLIANAAEEYISG